MSNETKILMPFIEGNDDPKYVMGFEAGQIWTKMERNERFNNYLFHTENKEQIEMMCKRFHYSCRIDKIDECWSKLFAKLTQSVN